MKKAWMLLGAALAWAGAGARGVWTAAEANAWFARQPFRAGVNYVPSYAVNPIETWAAETFDAAVIEREFALMESVGFNAVRVFLNELVVNADAAGFLARFETFLACADRHGAGVMVTFFTNGGTDDARLGPQPAAAGSHNSGWKKCPSYAVLGDRTRWDRLERYVTRVVGAHAKDRRVIAWDVFNEPGNIRSEHVKGGAAGLTPERTEELKAAALELVRASAQWARACEPEQPVTFGIWRNGGGADAARFNPVQIAESDVISYHSYGPLSAQARIARELGRHGRPLMCTEWMGRILGSTFNPILRFHKTNGIWSFAYGLVAGKTETWRPWPKDDTPEMRGIWFHDIFRPDGTPWDATEVAYIRSVLK